MFEFAKWGPLPVIGLISRVVKVINSTCRSEITPVKPFIYIYIYFQAIYFRAPCHFHLWSACQTLVEQQTELPERLEKDEEERKRPKYGGLGSCQFEKSEWEDVMYTVYCITDGRIGMILTWSLHEQWWTPWLIGLCRTNKFTEWHRCVLLRLTWDCLSCVPRPETFDQTGSRTWTAWVPWRWTSI